MSRRSDLDKGSVTGGLVNEAYIDVKIVADNMDAVLSLASNLPFPGGFSVTPTTDIGDGTVEGDMNAMDWTGHEHANKDIQTALEVKDNEQLYIFHKNIVYSYIGKRPVLIGVGGTATVTSDFSVEGTKSKALHFPDNDASDPALGDVATRANKFLGFDGNGDIIFSAGTAIVEANAVAILDTGDYFASANVEDALQEVAENFLNKNTGGTMLAPIKGVPGTPAEDELIRKDFAFTAIDNAAMPIGGIIMYSGSLANIPLNWAICDGNNGTPNLVDRFVYGTATESEIGNTGGSADAALVSHNHTFNGNALPSHSHRMKQFLASLNNGPVYVNSENSAFQESTEGKSAGTPSGTISTNGVSATNANLPPYVKLAYIQRKT